MEKIINQTSWPRSQHFKAFSSMTDPHFAVCFNVNIGPLLKEEHLFSTILFLIHQTCSEIPEFHYRITKDGSVKYYEDLDISFNILAKDDLFSNHRMSFEKSYRGFRKKVQQAVKEKSSKGIIEIDPQQEQNLIVTSFLPWFSFSGLKEPIIDKYDSIPRITWGKYTKDNELPISLQAHHGLMDGIHIGRFYSLLCKKILDWSPIEHMC